MLPLINNGVH